MRNRKKFLMVILSGKSDGNIPFDTLCTLLQYMGFGKKVDFTRK